MKIALYTFMSILLLACGQENNIAEIDGEGLSKAAFEAYLKHKRIATNDPENYQKQLEQYLKRSALAAAIKKSNKLDQTEVEAEVEQFRTQLLINRYFEQHLKNSVTDQGVQNFYVSHEAQYQTEKIHAAHILFRVKPNMGETERQAILTRAHEAHSKLTAGTDFAELAAAVSEDTVSAKKGGDLGWLAKGAISSEFSEKAFGLKKGEISAPLLTSFGFHIIKVLDNPQVVKRPLDAVKGEIRYQLRQKAKQSEQEALLKTVSYKIHEKKSH